MKDREAFNRKFFQGCSFKFIGSSCLLDMGNNLIAKVYLDVDGNGQSNGYCLEIVSKTAGLLTKEKFFFREHLNPSLRIDDRSDYKESFHVWKCNYGEIGFYIAVPSPANVRNMAKNICDFIDMWKVR